MKKLTGKTSTILQWIITVILGLAAIGSFADSAVAGIFLVLATVIACPITRNAIVGWINARAGDKSPLKKAKGWMYGAFALLCVCIGTGAMPESDVVHEVAQGESVQVESYVETNEILEVLVESGNNLDSERLVNISSEREESEVASEAIEENSQETLSEVLESTEYIIATEEVVAEPTTEPVQKESEIQSSGTSTGSYAVNGKNGKIHIVGACSATGTGDNAMKEPFYFNTFEEAEAYSATIESKPEKRKCGNCWR